MLTVCIMSYKYGHLASHAIESVLAQTRKPDEILLVDDGVADCRDVAKRYGIMLIEREKNRGIVDNFNNILFEAVTTDRVMFLGADNWLRPDALERMMEIDADIVSSEIALFGTEADRFAKIVGAIESRDGFTIWRMHNDRDINSTNYIHGSAIYNVELARSVGGYIRGEGVNSDEDHMLWKKMLKAGASYGHVCEPLLYYRRHVGNFQKI